jgi:hypothetical protein
MMPDPFRDRRNFIVKLYITSLVRGADRFQEINCIIIGSAMHENLINLLFASFAFDVEIILESTFPIDSASLSRSVFGGYPSDAFASSSQY